MEWIDMPAHRVLVISHEELINDFERYGEDGFPPAVGQSAYRIVRTKDHKVFRIAQFQPREWAARCIMALEEV